MGADNTIGLKIGEGPAGRRVEAGPHASGRADPGWRSPSDRWSRISATTSRRLESPARQAEGEIMLQGKVTLRSYPGGHYRYAVAVGRANTW